MSLNIETTCQHPKIEFPEIATRSEQQAFFDRYGPKIELSLACPSCSLSTHANLQENIETAMETLLRFDPTVYMVTERHPPSATPAKTDFLTQEEIKQNPSLKRLGNGGYYNYPDPVGSAIQPYPVTEEKLKVLEQLVFNHSLQKHALVKEGCYSKADAACQLLLNTGLQDDNVFKIYYYPKAGGMNVKTVKGDYFWNYHVVAALKDSNNNTHIFDSAFDQSKSILLKDWCKHIGADEQNITLLKQNDITDEIIRGKDKEYFFQTSSLEFIVWSDAGKPTIRPYSTPSAPCAIIAFLLRCHLRQTLKTYPLTALATAPYRTLLKPSFALKGKIISEVELHHTCALKKLDESIKMNTFFMTEGDIEHIKPCFINTENELQQATKNLRAAFKLVSKSTIATTTKSALKVALLDKVNELSSAKPEDQKQIYVDLVKKSYLNWEHLLKNRHGVETLTDSKLFQKIKENIKKLN